MNIWTLRWILWSLAVLTSFLIIELDSIPYDGSLSRQVWKLIGFDQNLTTGVRLRRIGFVILWFGLWTVLTVHFFFGGLFI